MSPSSIRSLLAMTFAACRLPWRQRALLARQARAQLQQRYPLAGCVVSQDDGSTRVLLVGRN